METLNYKYGTQANGLPNPAFVYGREEEGLIEIMQRAAPIKDILSAIVLNAVINAAGLGLLLGKDLKKLEKYDEKFLEPHLAHLRFQNNGREIIKIGRFYNEERILDLDYVEGMAVKTFIVAKEGKLYFCSKPFDANHKGYTANDLLQQTALSMMQ